MGTTCTSLTANLALPADENPAPEELTNRSRLQNEIRTWIHTLVEEVHHHHAAYETRG